jgi:fatty acid desaturase
MLLLVVIVAVIVVLVTVFLVSVVPQLLLLLIVVLVCFTDQLQAGAAQFDTNAHRLKRKMWWQNCKVMNPRCLECTENSVGRDTFSLFIF